MNFTQTARLALINSRAAEIIAQGYTFRPDAELDSVMVFKPGAYETGGTFAYTIDTFGGRCDCDCPAFGRDGFCKHSIAWARLADEAAREAAQVTEYETSDAGRFDALCARHGL